MSWIDRINESKLSITTGDGKTYTPLWKNAILNINFNTEGLEFIGVPGTFVGREEVKGQQFPLLIYFQGEDCIDVAKEFRISSADKRPWKISHPYYDDLLVQPLGLKFDDSQLNVVKITGTLWETLDQKYPTNKVNAPKEIEIKKSEIDLLTQESFVIKLETPSTELIQPANDSVIKTGSNYSFLAQTKDEITDLKSKVTAASGAAQEITTNTSSYIKKANDLINFPFLTKQNIVVKVDQLINTFNDFAGVFLEDPTAEKKATYEFQSTMLLSELSLNLIDTDINEFDKRSDVISVIDSLTLAYDTFGETMDDLGYTQDSELALRLDYIVNFTLSSLYDVALNSKQERFFTLDKDNNIVNLAHRFYGTGDDNLDLFIKQNDITYNEILNIKKGREIVYFV